MKKILLWSLYLFTVVLLIVGGINRTASRLGISIEIPFLPTVPTSQESERIRGEDQAFVVDTLLQQGTVIELSSRSATIELVSGQIALIERRAWRYALESGLNLQIGDQVQLLGFFEGQIFEITQITNLNSGQSVSLRDALGHPLWSGDE